MNQILSTELKKVKVGQAQPAPKGAGCACPTLTQNWFKFQFIFSFFIVILLLSGSGFYFYHLHQKEDFSNQLLSNYNIYRLYSSTENNQTQIQENENDNQLFGAIEIPKINLYYPVFSHLTEDFLKISPCKFYGDSPAINGNICIAGHNYDNSLFFSKISTLATNDEVFIYDCNGKPYIYFVYDSYEVLASDLSPVLNYDSNEKILTLITCNNFNHNRIVLKAKQKKLS